MVTMMKCPKCGAELLSDSTFNTLNHAHVTCTGCKKGWFTIEKYINDGVHKRIGEYQ